MCINCETPVQSPLTSTFHSHQVFQRKTLDELKLNLPAASSDAVQPTDQSLFISPYPFFNSRESTTSLAAALVGKTDGGTTTCLVYLKGAGDEDLWSWFCVDKFIDGKLFDDVVNERIQDVLAKVSPSMRTDVQAKLRALNGSNAVGTSCNFWSLWQKNRDHVCGHTTALIEAYKAQNPGKDIEQELKAYYNEIVSGVASAPSDGKLDMFSRTAFRYPIMVVGESGSGKTRDTLVYANETRAKLVKLSCEAGTSAAEITGYYMKAPDGNFVWVDGKVTAAFRLAAGRKTNSAEPKVVLLVDEMLRADPRELAIFLSAFERNPVTDRYELDTGRILSAPDGVAVLERLSVNPKDICIVATTNLGGKYSVGIMDKALQDRFVFIRKDNDRAGIKSAAEEACRQAALPVDIAEYCAKFWEAMVRAKQQSQVTETPSKRTINRAIELSTTPAEVPLMLKHMAEHWTSLDMDGMPTKSELEMVSKLVDESFTP